MEQLDEQSYPEPYDSFNVLDRPKSQSYSLLQQSDKNSRSSYVENVEPYGVVELKSYTQQASFDGPNLYAAIAVSRLTKN